MLTLALGVFLTLRGFKICRIFKIPSLLVRTESILASCSLSSHFPSLGLLKGGVQIRGRHGHLSAETEACVGFPAHLADGQPAQRGRQRHEPSSCPAAGGEFSRFQLSFFSYFF